MSKRTPSIPPADRAIFASLYRSITEEMGGVLRRTAYSPNIKERRDFSCALFDADGAMVAQAAHIPVHLGAMPMSVAAVLSAAPDLRAGDVIMLNDPYAGGTHLPDITLVSPVLHGKHRAALLATRAHHADVGGVSPGSLPLATEIYQEGLRIPPVPLARGGVVDEDRVRLLCANVRTPEEREGDLRAQLAAHRLGEQRLTEALDQHGRARIRAGMQSLLDHGREVMQSVIRAIPDGTYRFEDQLDGDGIDPAPLPIRAAITIRGARARVDFAGSSPACAGSLNAVEAITRSAVTYCFLCLAATPSRLHGEPIDDPPLNAGCFRAIEVEAPRGSLVNAEPPHAVAGGNVETSQRIVDVVFGALAHALPDIIPAASQGTMNNLTLGGRDPARGRSFAYYETIGGGMGARPDRPGLDAVQTHMTNTLNTPVEALEFAAPLRVRRLEIAARTGGSGRHRGGHGIRRELDILAPCTGTLLTDRRDSAPYGLAGGRPGTSGRNTLTRANRTRTLPGKTRLDLQPGDTLSLRTPGGGGHGHTS